MIYDKKSFQRLNTDDNERFLENTDYINLENCVIAQNEFGRNFQVQNVPSTQLLFYYTSGLNSLGTAVDYNKKRLFWLDHNETSGLDTLFCYDLNTKTTYRVAVSTQITGGFNLSNDYRIDRNFKIINGLAVWSDNLNEPKCIDIEAGIKLNQPSYVTSVQPYATPIPYETATVIKRPPIYRLQTAKAFDPSFVNNYIKLNSYQFCYRYQYKNYQYSCLSTFSQLIPFNAADDNFNYINVKANFSETIPDYVLQVDICARYGNEGKTFIVKSYNKNNPYDAIAIQSHNAGAVQLGFSFYDSLAGIALDEITANTSFHSVALKAKTIEAAKNRQFFGNVLKGYNTPSQTSLTLSLGTFNTGGGTYTGEWKRMTLSYHPNSNPSLHFTDTLNYIYVTGQNPSSYYYSAYGRGGSFPPSVNASDALISYDTELNLAYYLIRNNIDPPANSTWDYMPTPIFTDLGESVNVIVAATSSLQFYKSSSTYQVSVAFYDRFRRKCGVVPTLIGITIPDRTSDQTVFATNINWVLNNINALVEIPDWAYFYQIHISKNQTTRFFEQIFSPNSNYATKNTDGTFSYSGTYTANTTYAIAIDLTSLTSYGLGYTFNEGDLARVYFSDGTNKTYAVLGTDSNYVLLSPADIGALGTGTGFLIELYTPYKPSVSEPMYETGDVLPVINPTTDSRQYSTLSGSINGDTYAIERANGVTLYFVEAMSPNDNVWQFWETDRGWVNFIDTIGQQQKETAIDYSDTFITGAKTNGLNVFQPLNTKDVGSSSGSIQKLQLTNKMEESGTVMLVITDTDTLSAYLGEVQLYNAASLEGLITTADVIGSVNSLQNGQGTINPESVTEYNGTVWWFNALKGVVAQYDNNGVSNLNEIKANRFWDRYSKRYVELGKDAVKALCGFSHITGCVDLTNDFYILVLPQTEPDDFAPNLPSYDDVVPPYASSIQNRFDFYDGKPKTVLFDFTNNKWIGSFQWLPECMEYFGNKLFAFKEGFLYLHNEINTSFNVIYGVQYPQRICFTCNMPPSAIKDILNIALEGNKIPDFTVLYSTYPNEQITDIANTDVDINGNLVWQNIEGAMYAHFFRDRLSPNTDGTVVDKLYKGDVIKGAVTYVMLEFQEYDEQLLLSMTNIGFQLSKGQGNLLPKTKS